MMFVDWCAICGVHFTSLSAVPRHLCLRRSNVCVCQECSKTHAVQVGVPQKLHICCVGRWGSGSLVSHSNMLTWTLRSATVTATKQPV